VPTRPPPPSLNASFSLQVQHQLGTLADKVLRGTLPDGAARRLTAALLDYLYESLAAAVLALNDIPAQQARPRPRPTAE